MSYYISLELGILRRTKKLKIRTKIKKKTPNYGAKLLLIPMNKPIHEKLSSQIDAGVKLAMKKAIERHRRLGESISIWQDGQVVTLTAEQIPPLNSDE